MLIFLGLWGPIANANAYMRSPIRAHVGTNHPAARADYREAKGPWASPRQLDAPTCRLTSSRGPMDRLGIANECRQQASYCRTRAETASDEKVRALLVSMALIWTKLTEEAERIRRTKLRCRK